MAGKKWSKAHRAKYNGTIAERNKKRHKPEKRKITLEGIESHLCSLVAEAQAMSCRLTWELSALRDEIRRQA